jgi:hypothetical protein
MPGVALVSPAENSLRLISRAAVTATITGTVAWEAMLLGRPALVIGNSPFLALGAGVMHCPEFTQLPQAIAQAAQMPPASDESLISYISCLIKESAELPAELLWGKPDAELLARNRKTTDFFVDRILAARSVGIRQGQDDAA